MKRTHCAAFVCVILCALLCTVKSYHQEGSCGEKLTFVLDDQTLTISGEGPMTDFQGQTLAPWNGRKFDIKTIVMEEGLTHVGDNAFYFCDALEDVTLPSTLTSIGTDSFSFSAFKRIELPANLEIIGNYSFYECRSLKTIVMSSSVKIIGDYAFAYCQALQGFSIPSQVTSIGEKAFYYCDGLTSFDVEAGNAHFSSMNGILFNLDGSVLIAYPAGSRNTIFTIPDSVTSIGDHAFSASKYLKNVTIPEKVVSIGRCAFCYCFELENVSLSDGLTSIGESAFRSCTKMRELFIPKSVSFIGSCSFLFCRSASIVVSEENDYYTSVDGVIFDKGITTLVYYSHSLKNTSYSVPETVTTLGDYCFSGITTLSEVVLPEHLTVIGNYSFESCGNIGEMPIPKSVVSIGNRAFYQCTYLQTNLPESLTWIGEYAFYGCSKLETIVIPNGVTTVRDCTFSSCSNLKNVTIPDSVISVGEDVFSSGLTSVFFEGSSDIFGNAFASCSSLEVVCVPPDFEGTQLGGKAVNISSELCTAFRSMFNHCFKASYKDGGFIQTKRNNATEWEHQKGQCGEYYCDNESGGIAWSLCNSSDGSVVCLNDKCVEKNTMNDNGWTVELEMDNVKFEEMSKAELTDNIIRLTGLSKDDFVIGIEVDERGFILHIILYVNDEMTAKKVAAAIDDMEKGDECAFGDLCRTKSTHVTGIDWSLSNGRQTSTNALLFLSSFLLLIVYHP